MQMNPIYCFYKCPLISVHVFVIVAATTVYPCVAPANVVRITDKIAICCFYWKELIYLVVRLAISIICSRRRSSHEKRDNRSIESLNWCLNDKNASSRLLFILISSFCRFRFVLGFCYKLTCDNFNCIRILKMANPDGDTHTHTHTPCLCRWQMACVVHNVHCARFCLCTILRRTTIAIYSFQANDLFNWYNIHEHWLARTRKIVYFIKKFSHL